MKRFKDYGIIIVDTGAGEKVVTCPKCKKIELFVNLDTGQFNCKSCGYNNELINDEV